MIVVLILTVIRVNLLDYSVSSGNTALANHLESTGRMLCTLAKHIHNDLIKCIGSHIRDKILDEIGEAKSYCIYSVMRLLIFPTGSKYLLCYVCREYL